MRAVPAAAAAWYAEFMHHMSVQQPVNMLPYSAAWPWNYHYAQSQMAAQAMSAAAMGIRNGPGMEGFFPSIRIPVLLCGILCRDFTVGRGCDVIPGSGKESCARSWHTCAVSFQRHLYIAAGANVSVNGLCSIGQPAPDFNTGLVCVRPMWAEAITVHAGNPRMMWQSTGAQGGALGLQQAMAAQAAQQQQQQGPQVQVRPC